MQRIWKAAKSALINSAERAKRIQQNKPKKTIAQGSLVYHLVEVSGNIKQKFSDKWEGPYHVLRTRTNHAFCEHVHSKTQSWFHVDKLKLADGLYETNMALFELPDDFLFF